jgi:hypothetical protein
LGGKELGKTNREERNREERNREKRTGMFIALVIKAENPIL